MLGLALLNLLSWNCEADKPSHPKPVRFHRRARHGRVEPSSTDKGRMGGHVRAGVGSAISVHSSRKGDVPADQAFPVKAKTELAQGKRGEGRSVAPGRLVAGQNGSPLQHVMLRDEGTPRSRARVPRMPSSGGSPNLLASFAGKNRVLVISAPHDSDGYYRLMMSLLKPDVYCELAERHVHQIVMFHQEGELGGKVRRITTEGKVMEEPLDTALIPRLMSFLKLEKGKGCVLAQSSLEVLVKWTSADRYLHMSDILSW